MERFWAKVDKSGECWEWTGCKQPSGYGKFRINSQHHRAHRVAWQLTYGDIPSDLLVCHHCDNPSCVNPAHLFLGTQKDNVQDSVRKGRFYTAKGEKRWNAKLIAEDVLRIREAFLFGAKVKDLAAVYGVGVQNIRKIIRKESWAHI